MRGHQRLFQPPQDRALHHPGPGRLENIEKVVHQDFHANGLKSWHLHRGLLMDGWLGGLREVAQASRLWTLALPPQSSPKLRKCWLRGKNVRKKSVYC